MSTDPYRLSLQIEHADGSFKRWGSDEADAIDVPADLEFGTGIPGGYLDLACSLLRRIDLDYADLNEYDTVRVLGPGRETVWEGRFARFPRQHGSSFSVQPGAEGWVAHLRDDETFHEVYADRDLSRWGEASLGWHSANVTANFSQNGPTVRPDGAAGLPALILGFTGAWASPAKPAATARYDAGPGLTIAAAYVKWVLGPNATTTAPFAHRLIVSDVDDQSALTTEIDNTAAATLSTGGYDTFATARRYLNLEFRYDNTGAGTNGLEYDIRLQNLTLYGNHGLTRRGDDPGGFYASDLVADIVSRTAPLLTYTTGDGGSVETNTTTIEHLIFPDPTTGEEAIRKVTDYTLWEWGVYNDRRFFWRAPDEDRCCWQARLDEGARPSLDGPSGIDRPNGVMVAYQDFAGASHLVGPPGSSAETTSTDLEDDDPQHPATLSGIRKWPTLSIGEPTSEDLAIALGRTWLQERTRLAQRRGEIELTGMVAHPTAGARPVWAIKAGDYIQFTDANNPVKRRIIETRYTHETRTIRLTLDNSAYRADAIMARLGASLVGAI